jgi:DNA-3-methyladenine glycosylase II
MQEKIHKALTANALTAACNYLASDCCLGQIYSDYGVPPLWDRPTGFKTLLQIILEQQVSLASAKACFDNLVSRIKDVTPENLLTLSDVDLRTLGFSRQKALYARHLADAILEQRIDLDSLGHLNDDEVRGELITLKGVGRWTCDIYLLMALLRPDVMPRGDVALHSSWQRLTGGARPTPEEFISIAERWSPHRSTAARLLWHFYLSERGRKATVVDSVL